MVKKIARIRGTMGDNSRKAFSYEKSTGKDEWLTPPEIVRALGDFDLDPCSPICRPWDTAKKHYTKIDDGLMQPWFGRVWLNPPYGSQTHKWMARLAEHGDGIALIFARTETKTFFQSVWGKANAMLWLRGRLRFYSVSGVRSSSAVAPSVLIAYGEDNALALALSGIDGHFMQCVVAN